MRQMMEDFQGKPFTVLGFPCNQFGGQEPWSDKKIAEVTKAKYGRNFPLFAKSDVNGPTANVVYKTLYKSFPGDITWNFASRFLVDKNGNCVKRFDKGVSWKEITEAVADEIKKPYKATNEDEKGNEPPQVVLDKVADVTASARPSGVTAPDLMGLADTPKDEVSSKGASMVSVAGGREPVSKKDAVGSVEAKGPSDL